MAKMFIVPLARSKYGAEYVEYYTTPAFRIETENVEWNNATQTGHLKN